MHVPDEKNSPEAKPYGQKLGIVLFLVTATFLGLALLADLFRTLLR